MHGSPCFDWIHFDMTLLFVLCLQQEMLSVFDFLKQNSAIFCSFTGMAFGVGKFHRSNQDVKS